VLSRPGAEIENASAASITCGSCSTTTSELPASRRRRITSITVLCRAMQAVEGSSSTKSVLTSESAERSRQVMR